MAALTSIICLTAIIIMALICNTIAIYFVYARRRKVMMKDIIITMLCVINLIQIAGYSIELHSAITNKVNDIACRAAAFIVCTCTYTSIGCFVSLMLERYTAIIYPFKYVIWSSRKRLKALCLILPLIYGFFLGGPPLFGWGSYGRSSPNATYCAFDFKGRTASDKSFFYFAISLSFGLPLTISTICFGRILLELRKTASAFKRQYGRSSIISRQSEKTVHEQCISSLLTALIYIGSWLPYAIVCFLFFYRKYVPLSFELAAIYLAKSSTVTSPIAFCLIEKRVRQFIKSKSNGDLIEENTTSKEQNESDKHNTLSLVK